MLREAGATDADRLFVVAGAPVFLRQLRERYGRRVGGDPAAELFNARSDGHSSIMGGPGARHTQPGQGQLSVWPA